MTATPDRPVRRAAAGLLAGTLAVTGGVLVAGLPANAVEGFAFERLDGTDRFDTAAQIALDTFDTATTAVLASGADNNFADALAGNYLAGAQEAPVLLTQPTSLPDVTADALEDLGVEDVVIIGGTSAVSSGVENELRRLGYTTRRLGGSDRYATGALVVDDTAQDEANLGDDPDGNRTAVLGNGQGFADILAAGPLAYSELFPLLLTRPTDLPDSTAGLLRDLDIERVIIVGGPAAVSRAVEDEVEGIVGAGTVDRIAGADRFGTAADLAELAYDELGYDDTHVNLARGDGFADALAGGPHAGRERAPIVTTFPTSLPAVTEDLLEERSTTLEDGHIFGGGTSAVSTAVESRAENAAEGDTPRPSPSPSGPGAPVVTPDTAESRTGVTNPDTTTTDDRTYSVTGLTAGQEYRVTLVRTETTSTNSAGRTVYTEDGSSGLAATGSPTADITSVNGAAPQNNTGDGTTRTTNASGNSPSAVFTAASNGQATFVVDGDQTPESVRPVVYRNGGSGNTAADGGSSPRLDLNDDGTAADESDIGGAVSFSSATLRDAAATVRPELVRAEVVRTATPAQAGVSTTDDIQTGTVVRYVFDEEITGTRPVNETAFHVYDFDGTQFTAVNDESTIESGANSVLVRYLAVDTTDEAARLRLATVDAEGVNDNEGSGNPIGDRPLGTATATTGALTAGRTLAPDLVSIGNFRSLPSDPPMFPEMGDDPGDFTTVEFSFDERAFTVSTTGFHVVTTDGQDLACTAPANQAGGNPGQGEQGDATIDASCEEPAAPGGGTVNLTASNVARGYVEAGTVNDDDPGTAGGVVEGDARTNPLQSSDSPDAGTTEPDLQSASLEFSTAGSANGQDVALYVFDEPVLVANAAPTTTPPVIGTEADADGDTGQLDFVAYRQDGTEVTALRVERSSTSTTVRATFADGVLDQAVGVSVRGSAVTGQTGTTGRVNEEDEVGVSNPTTGTSGQDAGRTADPDLATVSVQDGSSGQTVVAYVFDEDLRTGQPTTGRFTLLQADGTRLICTSAARGTTEGDDNVVLCTTFVFAAADGTATGATATATQVRNAVAGAVDDDAVVSEDVPTGGTVTDFGNPEGAELLTGSTGTAQQ